MIRIALCDDEKYFRKRIKELIEQNLARYQWICETDYEVADYGSGSEMLADRECLKQFDIFFLDISMNGENGIEIARQIREVNEQALLVFVTAYVDYAVDGYLVQAVRFVLKDALEAMMRECIDFLVDKWQREREKLTFVMAEGMVQLCPKDICYIESMGHQLHFYMAEGKQRRYSARNSLRDVERLLGKYGFYRIHRGFLVNMRRVKILNNYQALTDQGQWLPISKDKYQSVKAQYFKMMGEL